MYLGHIPIDHPLRRLYRTLAGLAGLYLLGFGVSGLVVTSGLDLFAQEHLPRVLGLAVNPANAVLSVTLGVLTLIAAVVGRNVDHYVTLLVGVLLLVVGLWQLAVLSTDFRFLGFSMANCIVTFVLGLLFMTAGLYIRTMSAKELASGAHAVPHATVT